MSICDKFSIIENHLQTEDKKKVVNKLENYFENFLSSDIKILIPDYVNQVIWFEGINLENFNINIDSHIKNYLIQRRNNMRTFIKKENFDISSLNKFLKNFISKLEYLNNVIKTTDNKIVKDGIYQLANMIISDSLILLFIEEQIVNLDDNLHHDIETFLELTKGLKKYDEQQTFNKLLQTFGYIFRKQIINMEDPPLPDYLKRIYKLSEALKYSKNIQNYFKFINDDIPKFNYTINQLILDYLCEIIKTNKLVEVEYIFENIWPEFTKLIIEKSFEGKDESIKKVSEEIVGLIDRSLKENSIDNTFKLINILKFTDTLMVNQTLKDIINQKISTSLASEQLLENIHDNIDQLIKLGKEKDVTKLLNFASNIKEKDVFINKYYQLLIKRIMDKFAGITPKLFSDSSIDFKKYIEMEKNICENLRIKFGDKLIYKINKVICDTEFSFDDNSNFNKLNIENFQNKMSVITTSYANWDVNQTEGLVNSNMVESIKDTTLGKHLRNYQKYYELRYSNKRLLNWFPHFGEASVTYLDKELKMLPIQLMVIEMFNAENKKPVQEITSARFFSNYTPKFVNDIVGSLVVSGLFKVQNDFMVLNTTPDFKTNLIEIFFTNSDYASIWEQKRQDELAHTRVEIICSNINHHLKKKSFGRQELFTIVKESTNVFDVDQTTFDKAVEYMIKQDYIQLNEQVFEKIKY
jgi:hypothetical protein